MMLTSDDEIRAHSQVEIPAGVRIECTAMTDGCHILSFGGWLLDEPRLVLDLQPGAVEQLAAAVQRAMPSGVGPDAQFKKDEEDERTDNGN
jgi:hypothetical protein